MGLSENMKVNGKDYPIYHGKKMLKPPTSIYIYIWVCLKMLAKPHCTQSGFADHYPVLKNGYKSLGILTQHFQVQTRIGSRTPYDNQSTRRF